MTGALSFAAPTTALVILIWALATAYPTTLPSGSRSAFAALALSLLGLAATVPTLVSAIFSGALADRMDRRWLMRLTNAIALGGTLGLMVVLIIRPEDPVYLPGAPGFYLPEWAVIALPLWAMVTVGFTIFRPAFNASLPQLVSTAELGAANGLVSAGALSFSVVGSLGAPLLIPSVGEGAALGLAVIFFAGTEIALLSLPPSRSRTPGEGRPRRRFLTEAGDGYRYLWRHKQLLQITISALLINLFSAIAFVELGLYVTDWLGSGEAILVGAMLAGASLGAGLGAILVGRLGFERKAGAFLALLTMLQGAAVVVLALSRTIWISLPDMFLFGVFPGMFTTVFLATIQATVPNEMLGRVFAADEVGSYSMVPFGQYIGGLVTLAGGIQFTYLTAGLGTILVGVFMGSVGGLRRLGFEPQETNPIILPPPGAIGDVPAIDGPPPGGDVPGSSLA